MKVKVLKVFINKAEGGKLYEPSTNPTFDTEGLSKSRIKTLVDGGFIQDPATVKAPTKAEKKAKEEAVTITAGGEEVIVPISDVGGSQSALAYKPSADTAKAPESPVTAKQAASAKTKPKTSARSRKSTKK